MEKSTKICIFLLSLATLQAVARERTSQEKERLALEILAKAKGKAASHANSDANIISLKTEDAYTILGWEKGGFAIVSNDEGCKPIIGYSYEAAYSEQIPSLNWYLSMATKYLNEARNSRTKMPKDNNSRIIPDECQPEVEHLLSTQWGQGDPYWAKCPTDKHGKRCYTGCVATAMAQIMHYYQYPSTGSGKDTIYFANQPYVVNFGSAHYDWSNMLSSYTGTYNIAQKTAVATLMYHCGVAAGMAYDPNGSGAYMEDAAGGMQEHFGYITRYYGYKEHYDADKWKAVIYTELSKKHPLLYAGTSNKQGNENTFTHAFVLDGYDKDGYVGVNWGYSGDGNGYFDPDILTLNYKTGNTIVDEDFIWYNEMVVIHHPDAGNIDNALTNSITSPLITSLHQDMENSVRIYNTTGKLIYSSPAAKFRLKDIQAKGVLIVREGEKSYKIVR